MKVITFASTDGKAVSGLSTYETAVDANGLLMENNSLGVLTAFQLCAKLEGIIPALEPAHALAKVLDLAPEKPKDHLLVVNISGRGDMDIFTVADHLGGMATSHLS